MLAIVFVHILRNTHNGYAGNIQHGIGVKLGGGVGKILRLAEGKAFPEHAIPHVDGEMALHLGHGGKKKRHQQQGGQRTQQRPQRPTVKKPQQQAEAPVFIKIEPHPGGGQFKFLAAADACRLHLPAQLFPAGLDFFDLFFG